MNKKSLTLGFAQFGTGAGKPFNKLFDSVFPIGVNTVHEDVAKCDCVVIWGGADISPSIYNEPVHPKTRADDKPSMRDEYEMKIIRAAAASNIPIIGVCRGAQLVCAMAGGKLVQDVTGHYGDHEIITDEGDLYVTSSIHHQMMFPWNVPHKLLAWSEEPLSQEYLGLNPEMANEFAEDVATLEPEVVYFPGLLALAIQGHPEFMDSDCAFVQYCNGLVEQYLLASDKRPTAQVAEEV